MGGHRLNAILSTSGLALVLALGGVRVGLTQNPQPLDKAIEALTPAAEPDLAPPTADDVKRAPAASVTNPGTSTASSNPPSPNSAPSSVESSSAESSSPALSTPASSGPEPSVATVAPATPASNTAPSTQQAPATANTNGPAIEAVAVPDATELPPPTVRDFVAATLPPADLATAQKLHELLTAKSERLFTKKERTAVESFYNGRGFAPLWTEKGAANARAEATIAYLQHVDGDGLDPSDYPIPEFKTTIDGSGLAEAELRLVASVLTYARHAQIGRIHYSRVSGDIFYNQTPPDPTDVLAKIADTKNIGELLASYEPSHPQYKALKAKLAEVRGRGGDSEATRIPHGPVLKVGSDDGRVPLLRERLGISGEGTVYDKPLAEAIKKFQHRNGLAPSGTLTSATIEAFDGPRHGRDEDIIIANMERWRWLPRDLGKAYVMVNIPDFTLKVVHNGSTVWTTKVVVGKPSMPTPLISEAMRFITVNPTWNVPPSIVQNEYLPALQQDPMALERIGLKVEQNRDGTIHIYQPPGDRNALGRIRFNFPNKFLVYQHDTPDKNLFAHDVRAYSHGCMRVQDPLKYGEVLLSIADPKEGYTAERLARMFGSEERNINFVTPIPVHLTYQTAWVDDSGRLVIRNDVYGRDSRILAVLKGDERKVADVAVERRETTVHHQAFRLPPPANPYANSYSGGFPFFGQLFR